MKATKKVGKGDAVKTEPPKRAFTARSLSALLPAVTRPAFRKRSPATVTLFLEWGSIVGPAYASRTLPKKLTAGMLTIACRGPVAMELQHMQAGLIDRINTWCGPNTVVRLRLTQDFQAPADSGRTKRVKPAAVAPVSLPDMPEGPLRSALEALGSRISERGGRRR
ncbi:DciA family protein [Acetobacter oeni]|uniref:DUF721 domain-containing protein n=1 Tax=Acetobacter oeni TaxID=304077 RepID=A0A511XIW9_9PROT|nr:DciA family protein [Acetobacter oeni]MBB3882634.1 hypothetical protein [Acetobacter oeni]NHO18738.1 DUF721 domain-containing protein [Acetobacter oeni]GBR06629.1 hypothetical protein AA21952_2077 [Acetobacter oeni LMG 21952]GEN62890.1 hypothetical protein AOE01nite_11140 [Acetobacter oeni]